MKRIINYLLGFLLITIGTLYLLKTSGIYNIMDHINVGILLRYYWATIFIIIPGVILHIKHFINKEKDAVSFLTAGFLTFSGINCQIIALTNSLKTLWPGFILSLSLGMFEVYIYGKRERSIILGAVILLAVSCILFSRNIYNASNKEYIVPFFLIVIGIIIIFGNAARRKKV